ncbi:MAG TPA: hypothetical protein VFD98_05155 [Terracidiphilus sp.]|nr:hypothetical protein [Terracidiphilus sp.]
MRIFLWVVMGLFTAIMAAAQKRSATELIALANQHSSELRAAIEASFDAKNLKQGSAWASHGPEFFFAVELSSVPTSMIDDSAGPSMTQIPGSQLWYAATHIEP